MPLQVRPAYAKLNPLPSHLQETMPKATASPASPEYYGGHVPPVALLNAFNTHHRINHYLIDNLPIAAWKAKPADGKGRSIASIGAHMHNVRVMWLKATKAEEIPPQLDRATVTS